MDHKFGGIWTEIKLEILAKYLNFYTQALKGKPKPPNKLFKLLYIDAFAGTGQRTEELPEYALIGEEGKTLQYAGSARKALEIDRPFDRYLFIEKDSRRAAALDELKAEYPERYIKVLKGDANNSIQEMCNKPIWDKNDYRGVIFLDPYGNSVEWETLEAIAKTKSFDVWFLFPLSGVYRQAPHDPAKLTADKRHSLNRMFGTDRWEKEFYQAELTKDLFGIKEDITRLDVVYPRHVNLRISCFHDSNVLSHQ